jgi:hypothetical protein
MASKEVKSEESTTKEVQNPEQPRKEKKKQSTSKPTKPKTLTEHLAGIDSDDEGLL